MLATLFAVATLSGVARADTLIARGEFDAALRVANHAGAGEAEEIRGAVAEARDLLSEAEEHYDRALRIAINRNDSALMAESAEGVGRMYGQLGRTDLFLALANRMLERDPPHRALYLFERGVAASSLNDSSTAWQAFDESLRLAQEAGDLKLASQILRHRGLWIWRYQRDLPRALHEYDMALDAARRVQAWRIVALTLINYGNVLRNRDVNRLPEALQRYQEWLAIARREHLSFQIAYLLKNMGDVYRQQGRPEASEAVLTEALNMADQGNVRDIRWMARNQLGILMRDRDPKRAEQYLREAVQILEGEQSDVLLADFRAGAFADSVRFANPYDQLIDFLVGQNRAAEAFFVAEQERARAFLETLSASRDSIARAVPATYAASERRILDRIKIAQALLRTEALPDQKRSELLADVGRFEARLADLRLELAVENPSLAHARYPKLWTADAVQSKLLIPGETLVAFYLGGDRSVAWVLTRQSLTAIRLPPAKTIERDAQPALDSLRNPMARDRAALAALGRDLQIDAIEKLAGGARLIVVPHGALHDVPFDALVDSSGRMLVEHFAISYAPSASSLAFLRSVRRPVRTPATLLAVANPIVGSEAAATLRQGDLAHMNLLAPLPESAKEAQQIAQLFGSSARVLEGVSATRSALRVDGAERANILHFATHALIDETRPDRSGLVLTADPPRDDGLLQVRDIYRLHLDADLVTLSACETALGPNVTGEGILGLTRAFFFAGARSVVASMWDVDDASASQFMRDFYGSLRRGVPIDLALQRAKLDFIREGKPPFYWASFVVSGNAGQVIPAQETSSRLPLFAIAFVAIVGVYLAIVKVRRGDTATLRP
jgi:CHAT domain-containing protein